MKGSAWASLGRRAGWLAALAVLCIPSSASAHAAVVDTNPVDGSVLDSAPRSVTVTFNESIRLPADAARLYDAKGKRLAASAKAAGGAVTSQPRGLCLHRWPASSRWASWQPCGLSQTKCERRGLVTGP